MKATKGDYAEVNGLKMYYETRGTGRPLVVLPGTAHFIPPGSGVLDRAGWLVPMIGRFLDASEEAGARGGGWTD